MPTSKVKAQQFVRDVSVYASRRREELGIERADVDLSIGINVLDRVTYDEHEDED